MLRAIQGCGLLLRQLLPALEVAANLGVVGERTSAAPGTLAAGTGLAGRGEEANPPPEALPAELAVVALSEYASIT